MNKLTSEHIGTSKSGDEGGFYVSTMSAKSSEPKTLLSDYIRAANFPASYGEKGGIAVFDINHTADNQDRISGVKEIGSATTNIGQSERKFCGEKTIKLNPENFDQLFKGVISPDKLSPYKVPYDDSNYESHSRYFMAKGLNEQSLLVEALKTGGVLHSDQ
jgi:hypothetical protein